MPFRRGKYLYFTEEGLNNIQNHKYNGRNESILYGAFLKPLAVRCTNYVPTWVHPNAITLTGLFFPAMSYLFMWHYNPNLGEEVPSWLVFMCGINLFIYQTLDNMDGQQARRTGTSSALGQLFDHGCDAFNVTISSVTMAAMMQMSVLWATIFILCAQLNFYIATWDEYHTHEMYLPKINGADEGLVLTVLLYMLTAFVLPRGVWLMEVYTVPLNVWFTIVSLLSALFTANMFVGRVRDHSREKGWPLERAWWKLLPFGITVSQTVYWLLVVTAATNAFDYAVFEVLLCCAFCFGQFTSRLIVAHVCGMHFKAWQPALWVPMIPITAHILTAVLDVTVVPPSTVLHITLCISGLMWLHYAYVCINAISSSLGIRRFNIETRHVPEVSGVLPER